MSPSASWKLILMSRDDTEGVWDIDLDAIVIRRDKLRSRQNFAATLLHEVGHATSETADVTREFEGVLTRYLGMTSTSALDASRYDSGATNQTSGEIS